MFQRYVRGCCANCHTLFFLNSSTIEDSMRPEHFLLFGFLGNLSKVFFIKMPLSDEKSEIRFMTFRRFHSILESWWTPLFRNTPTSSCSGMDTVVILYLSLYETQQSEKIANNIQTIILYTVLESEVRCSFWTSYSLKTDLLTTIVWLSKTPLYIR